MKAGRSALKVTWKEANMLFLSHRGYNIKECQKAFQESTLFGLLVAWDQTVQWLLPRAAFSCVVQAGEVVKWKPSLHWVQSKPQQASQKTLQHPGHISLEPPRQKVCEAKRIAHAPHLRESARTGAGLLTERLSSDRDLPVVRDTQGSLEIETPSTQQPWDKTRRKKRKKRNKPNAQQTNNRKWWDRLGILMDHFNDSLNSVWCQQYCAQEGMC